MSCGKRGHAGSGNDADVSPSGCPPLLRGRGSFRLPAHLRLGWVQPSIRGTAVLTWESPASPTTHCCPIEAFPRQQGNVPSGEQWGGHRACGRPRTEAAGEDARAPGDRWCGIRSNGKAAGKCCLHLLVKPEKFSSWKPT